MSDEIEDVQREMCEKLRTALCHFSWDKFLAFEKTDDFVKPFEKLRALCRTLPPGRLKWEVLFRIRDLLKKSGARTLNDLLDQPIILDQHREYVVEAICIAQMTEALDEVCPTDWTRLHDLRFEGEL